MLSRDGTRTYYIAWIYSGRLSKALDRKPEFGSCDGSNMVTNQLIDDYCAIQNGTDAGFI
ncbi:hypothetical protein AGR1B_pa0211 [Agrobacterium fabacearum S56]|nr:hypothetical protein AGR1B_pa0211 [Agrobacterium fabacearum S56]